MLSACAPRVYIAAPTSLCYAIMLAMMIDYLASACIILKQRLSMLPDRCQASMACVLYCSYAALLSMAFQLQPPEALGGGMQEQYLELQLDVAYAFHCAYAALLSMAFQLQSPAARRSSAWS